MAARLICRFLPILRLNKMQSQISPRFRVLRHLSNTISQSQSTSMRSILCGLVRQDAVGKEVVISGWLQHLRDIGSITFLIIRDHSGSIQVTLSKKDPSTEYLLKNVADLKEGCVVQIAGTVQMRQEEFVNHKMPTGSIEIYPKSLSILNQTKTLPFQMEGSLNEDTRLKYRYLDLRRNEMQRNLRLRSSVVRAAREALYSQGFIEVETPTLFKSTPEGSKEFLVPTHQRGLFYALTQSPQQYKQLLMVGGIDRYFQIARCYRDEGMRADRQPEFTQIDLEMSYVNREDIMNATEKIVREMIENAKNIAPQFEFDPSWFSVAKTPFPRISYQEAMMRYGSDKPDLRFGFEISDITDIYNTNCLNEDIMHSIGNGGTVKAINFKGLAKATSRKQHQDLMEECNKIIATHGETYGIILPKLFAIRTTSQWKSGLAKQMTDSQISDLVERLNIQEGDSILLLYGKSDIICEALGKIRTKVANVMQSIGVLQIDPAELSLLWVIDFPLFSPKSVEDGGGY